VARDNQLKSTRSSRDVMHNLDNDIDAKKKRVERIIEVFRKLYPRPKCHLNFNSPLELLIGTILSAQCTDERVNQVTRTLFKKYRSARDYAKANPQELENDIRTTGFFRNKARSIIKCTKILDEKYSGGVPFVMEELIELDGVGRKTANVVLGNAFGKPATIVDTHIRRLAHRLGLSNKKDPDRIEVDLSDLVPRDQWTYFSLALGDHGRTICKARKPNCGECKINQLCPSAWTFD
jgi:endonuclease III